jgi:hypothetical protein
MINDCSDSTQETGAKVQRFKGSKIRGLGHRFKVARLQGCNDEMVYYYFNGSNGSKGANGANGSKGSKGARVGPGLTDRDTAQRGGAVPGAGVELELSTRGPL